MDAPGARDRVLLLALDGFPYQALSAEQTPVLDALASSGGRAPRGGLADLPATTYPGFASLLTGCRPERHGVRTTNHRFGIVPGWAGRRSVAVPTLVDTAEAAGLGTAAVLGDHHLHRVLRLGSRTRWPRDGRVPWGTARDAHGYPTNAAVRQPLLRVADEPGWRFLFAHLNEVDTVGHVLGPGHPQTIAAYRATDVLVGELLEVLRPGWSRTLVIVVSDHGMEAAERAPGIDPAADPLAAGIVDGWIADGGAAWVRIRHDVEPEAAGARLAAIDGVEGWAYAGDRRMLLTARPGRRFGHAPQGGVHGGPNSQGTVAIVGGGHPAAASIGAAIVARPPGLADWAPTIALVLGIPLPGVDGRSLLA